MIVEGLYFLMLLPIRGLLSILPTTPTPPDTSAALPALTQMFQWLGWMNHYVPVKEMVIVLGLSLIAFQVVFTVRGILWLLTKLHVLGGSDG